MNRVKKIIALIMVIFVVIRVYVFSVSASFAAPFIAEETLKTVLIEGMLAGGADYTKDDLEAWELEDLENEFEIQMTTNPNFKLKKALPVFFDINNPGLGYNEDSAAFDKMADKVVSDWLSGALGENIYDKIHPTYSNSVDMQGGVSVLYDYWARDSKEYYSVYYSSEPAELYYTGSQLNYFIKYDYWEQHTPKGVTRFDESSTVTGALLSNKLRYGKWVWRKDGTEAETDDEAIPVIGEADGTQVTPDMLNPDGTLTIDGVTYYPKDFIDWDKFKDPAIIDLLNEILKVLENAPVVSDQDKPLGDVDEIEVTVPEELSDFTIPTGIVSVFPFCLPWDFVRGIKTLLAKPEVPVFKTEIDLTDFCGFDLGVIPIEISFEKWEPAVIIVRWFFLLLFIISLIMLTPKICKGAG